MRFGDNSRKGASSIITVMFVAVIALAGTLVFVALDRSILNADGYALPGSVIEYNSLDYENGVETYTVLGYHNGSYIWKTPGEYIDTEEMPTADKIGTETVNVPGIGKARAEIYSVTVAGYQATMRTVFHGLPYDITIFIGTISYKLIEIGKTDIELGTYGNTIDYEQNFTGKSGTATVDCVSQSTNGDYVFRVSSTATASNAFYIGNSKGIPVDFTSGSYTVASNGSSSVTLTISGDKITAISINGNSYTDAT